MKKVRNGFIKNLHYICLIGIIAFGLMTIVGTGNGNGNGNVYVQPSTSEGPYGVPFGCEEGGGGPDQEILDAVSQACNGIGVEDAADYNEAPGIHPIILLNHLGDRHTCTAGLPSDWWPESVDTTELVACVGNEEVEVIQTCYYTGGAPIQRHRYYVMINLVAAQTGETIETHKVRGDPPRHCGQTEPVSLTDLYGSHVTFDAVQNWLSDFVNL